MDRVYADFWLAYRLTFDTDERIIAAQNKFTELRFEGGSGSWRPDTRSSGIRPTRPKSRTLVTALSSSASRSLGVLPTGSSARERAEQLQGLVTELRDHGYREATVGPFRVFAPPP